MERDLTKNSEIVQRTDGVFRKVSGLWSCKSVNKRGKEVEFLKGGRMNIAAFENMQAFGEKTIFFVMKNQRKSHPNAPDYFLLSAEDLGTPMDEPKTYNFD